MRCVVGGDDIDGPVGQSFDQRLAVPGGPERRIHLETSVLLKVVLAERKIMGGGFAGHFDPAPFGLADDVHALGA